jgi:hypothetical protein
MQDVSHELSAAAAVGARPAMFANVVQRPGSALNGSSNFAVGDTLAVADDHELGST